jgi:hypothetical protein
MNKEGAEILFVLKLHYLSFIGSIAFAEVFRIDATLHQAAVNICDYSVLPKPHNESVHCVLGIERALAIFETEIRPLYCRKSATLFFLEMKPPEDKLLARRTPPQELGEDLTRRLP